MFPYSTTFLVIVSIASSVFAQGNCPCPPPPAGSNWQISEPYPYWVGPVQPPAIQCSYPSGACVWDTTGALLNTNETNCEPQIAANSTTCPNDNEGKSGNVTAHYQGYECLFIDETGFHPSPVCTYNAIGNTAPGCPQGQPCPISA